MLNYTATSPATDELAWEVRRHLHYNFAVPLRNLETAAVEAVALAREGHLDLEVSTPYPHVDYGYSVPAHALVSSLHLQRFVDAEAH